MFPRPAPSVRSLPKLTIAKTFSWPPKPRKVPARAPEVDFAAFRSGRAPDELDARPPQRATSARHPPRTAPRNIKRDTLFIDLSNNDLIPALDYAFAILDDDQVSVRSLPPPPPIMPNLSRGSSADSADSLRTPSSSARSPLRASASVRSSPPRYVSSPLGSSPCSSAVPSARPSPQRRSARPAQSHRAAASFDPDELSLALCHAQAASSPDLSPTSEHAVPFPPPAKPPATRVPLLLRKPRLHSAGSSVDGHDAFAYRSYPCSSKASLARSMSSLGHHPDASFGARSAISLHTPDPALSALLAQQPPARGPYGSLRLFSRKLRTPVRRASTPPPSRARLGIPSAQPPVPALPDVFLLGAAARREASSTSPSLLARATRAHTAL